MLDRILIGALARSESLRSLVDGELQRLSKEGFLSDGDAAQLRARHAERLAALSQGAGEHAGKALHGVGEALRAALDLPSRAEIVALTKELKQAREEQEPPCS